MKEISKEQAYKAMTHLFTITWKVNNENLDILLEYFHDELVKDYNELSPKLKTLYNGVDYDAKFAQRATDRIIYLFQQ